MTWVCPSCGQEWPEKPLVDGTIGCPECGSIATSEVPACEFGCGPTDDSTAGGRGFGLVPACPVHGWVCELLDASAARLSAAEQERDELSDELNSYETPLPYKAGYEDGKQAAEARVEAAEQALREILGYTTDGTLGPEVCKRACRLAARAALRKASSDGEVQK